MDMFTSQRQREQQEKVTISFETIDMFTSQRQREQQEKVTISFCIF